MLKPIGLTHGHYECRSLEETLPVLTDLMAMTVVARGKDEAVLQHPNTAWRLVVHEGGPNAPEKPRNNHYGFRVANLHEIEAAWRYIQTNQARYRLSRVTKPVAMHYATSVYLSEPGGNTLEIEHYDAQAVAEGRRIAAPHWERPLPEARFPGRGYVPQALTHGTLECDDKDASARFFKEVLGLEIAGGGRVSVYIKHPATPWYIVVIPAKRRRYLSPRNRLTLTVATPAEVESAHRDFKAMGAAGGITAVEPVEWRDGEVSFVLSDLDRNWWEVRAAAAARRG